MKNQTQVLVTGGAGFIGSELTRQLAQRDYGVTVLDNLVSGKAENIADLPEEDVRLVVSDIREEAVVAPLLRNLECIYHLACLGVRHSIHAPYENHEVNATATLKLLAASRDAGVKRFVCVSSSEVYGTAFQVPMTENHPPFPMTVYGASKLAGECYARAFYLTWRYPTVVVRPFNTYGPRSHHEGDSGEVIPKFILRCLAGKPMVVFGDGGQTRDFLNVRDTARGIILAGESADAIGQTINLGSGSEITINALAREIAHATGKDKTSIVHEEARPGDTLRLYADISKAGRLLEFKPEITLGEGIAQLLAWYRGLDRTPEELLEEEILHNWAKDGERG